VKKLIVTNFYTNSDIVIGVSWDTLKEYAKRDNGVIVTNKDARHLQPMFLRFDVGRTEVGNNNWEVL